MNEAYKSGATLATAMAAKLGTHEGSEGHPINFERSGDYHRMVRWYASVTYRQAFCEGYRDRWKELTG